MLGARLAALGFAKKFNPLQLFQKGAVGAWYDPSSLWGAADHLPRRNLLTYSEDISDATWTKTGLNTTGTPAYSNVAVGPFGETNADALIDDTATSQHFISSAQYSISSGAVVYALAYIKAAGRTKCFLDVVSNSAPYEYIRASVDLSTNAVSPASGSGGSTLAASCVDAGSGWKLVTVSGTIGTKTDPRLKVLCVNDSYAASYLGAGATALYFGGAMLCHNSTTDKSYQKVTDWTAELYAHAAAKNVPWLRRNILKNTGNFSDWIIQGTLTSKTPNYTSAPDGSNTATRLVASSASSIGRIYNNYVIAVSATAKQLLTFSVWLKSNTGTSQLCRIFLGAPLAENDTYLFTVTTEWTRFSYSRIPSTAAGAPEYVYIGRFISDSAVGDIDILMWGAQLEIAATPTTYQPIGASWEAQYAANAAAAGVALTMYQDSAGTTPVTGPDSVIGKLNDLSGNNYHAVQTGATGLKPALRLCPNGCWHIQRDLTDDALVTTFPNLGTSCVSYINDGSTVSETTGVTLNGALTQNTPAADYGRIYLSAPSSKAAQIIKWLKAKARL